MKKYHISKPWDIDAHYIRIHNDDENPIVNYINCRVYNAESSGAGKLVRMVEVKFVNETEEIRKSFHAIADIQRNLIMGSESIVNQDDMKNIIHFFKVIQTIDPLPLRVFTEINHIIDSFDLSKLLNHKLIEQAVSEKKHTEALDMAIDADIKGDDEAMALLANLYQKSDDMQNYLTVLSKFPRKHEQFVAVNKIVHDKLVEYPIPNNEAERLTLLEKKLEAALNSDDRSMASRYYDELAGSNGLNIQIEDIKGDPETLIKLARHQRQMRKEIEELKNYKARNEAGRAAEKRQEVNGDQDGSKPRFF